MPEAAFGDLFASFALPAGALTQFWEKLPNYGRQWPTLQTKGTVELRDVQVFLGNSSRSDGGWARTPSAGELGVVWLSGWYVGSGAVQFELAMPNRMVLFASSKQPLQTFRLAGQTTLQPRDAGERWVGALHARQVAEMLGAEMRLLQARPTGRRQMVNTDPAARETRLTQLRREVVRLSRTFGFISSETAFIALPPDLQRKYGITPQETSAQQSYTPCPVGIVPEPAAWQLAVIGFAVLASIAWSRRRRLWQR
jgi:hypothetical protein